MKNKCPNCMKKLTFITVYGGWDGNECKLCCPSCKMPLQTTKISIFINRMTMFFISLGLINLLLGFFEAFITYICLAIALAFLVSSFFVDRYVIKECIEKPKV